MRYVALFLLLALSTAMAKAQVYVEFMPGVRTSVGAVRLGDIASLRTTDLSMLQRLLRLKVPVVLDSQGNAKVLRQDVLAEVRKHDELKNAELQWAGNNEVDVRRMGAELQGQEIVQEASKALRAWLAQQALQFEVNPSAVPLNVPVPTGTVQVHARPLSDAAVRSHMVVWVDIWGNGAFLRTVSVNFDVAVWREVLTATEPLTIGSPIDSSMVTPRQVDIARLNGHGRMLDSPPDGRTTRSLSPGDVLFAKDVEAKPAVSRGRRAILRLHSGVISVESYVDVLQDGRLGQNVRVKPMGSGASLMAKVAGPDLVEVAR